MLAIDSLALGPAVGGVRTLVGATEEEAIRDAVALARAMTLKCAIAGLDAGGAKAVVLAGPGMDRPAAFRRLGEHVQEFGGLYRCAGDLGTTPADLAAMRSTTQYVTTDQVALIAAAGRGVLRCIEACLDLAGGAVAGLRVLVIGAGAMGEGVALALAGAGAEILVADLDSSRAERLAAAVNGRAVPSDRWYDLEADIVAPCATGGLIDANAARSVRAWAICGTANNQLASPEAGEILRSRGVLYVPDFIASAGPVIQGIAPSVMGVQDAGAMIDALGETAMRVLELARSEQVQPAVLAERIARERIGQAGCAQSGLPALRKAVAS